GRAHDPQDQAELPGAGPGWVPERLLGLYTRFLGPGQPLQQVLTGGLVTGLLGQQELVPIVQVYGAQVFSALLLDLQPDLVLLQPRCPTQRRIGAEKLPLEWGLVPFLERHDLVLTRDRIQRLLRGSIRRHQQRKNEGLQVHSNTRSSENTPSRVASFSAGINPSIARIKPIFIVVMPANSLAGMCSLNAFSAAWRLPNPMNSLYSSNEPSFFNCLAQ